VTLSAAPGQWRWEDRGERGWWRVHDELQIEDGPHATPPERLDRTRALIEVLLAHDLPDVDELRRKFLAGSIAAVVLADELGVLDP
jgi:hypothetical protein